MSARPPARYEPLSPWIARPADLAPPLREERRTDVAIVGGGYTGLSTALSLRAAGADVVLLEEEFAGFGASGRNAGHLTPTIGKDLPSLLRLFGRERAAALVRFADEAVAYSEELIAKHASDCDYLASGNVLAAVAPGQERSLRRAAELGAGLGARLRFLPAGEMRERRLPRAFLCGVLEERGGTLHPGRYALGLRRAARAAGVHLFEGTRVLAIEDDPHPRLRTPGGSVRADAVVLATNAYTPRLGWAKRAVLPLRVSLFETEPLGPERRAALGWPGAEGLYTAHESLESYRLTAHGTLVGGAKIVHYAYGSRLAHGERPRTFARLEAAFRERLPELADLPVARFWGGWIAFPLDLLPSLGSTGRHGRIHFGLGYAGHGLAQASFMGALLAELVQGRAHPAARALARRPWPLPPEPLRWLAFQLATAALAVVDGRTDRRARRLARSRALGEGDLG